MFMPDWVDRNDPQALKTLGQKHMAEIAERYGRDIAVWDVVNEEIPRLATPAEWHAVPGRLPGLVFPRGRPPVPETGEAVDQRRHQPGPRHDGPVRGDDRGLLRRGCAWRASASSSIPAAADVRGKLYRPSSLYAVYERLGRLGLPLYITEITIPGAGEDGPAQQAAIVANLYRLWFSTPAMAGVTWWNLADGTAYREREQGPGRPARQGHESQAGLSGPGQTDQPRVEDQPRGQTDAQGKARFRGFRGQVHASQVTAGQPGPRQFEIDLSEGGPATYKLTLKP